MPIHPKFQQRLLQRHAHNIAKDGELNALLEFRKKFGTDAYRSIIKGLPPKKPDPKPSGDGQED
jgi:hypothetical protein